MFQPPLLTTHFDAKNTLMFPNLMHAVSSSVERNGNNLHRLILDTLPYALPIWYHKTSLNFCRKVFDLQYSLYYFELFTHELSCWAENNFVLILGIHVPPWMHVSWWHKNRLIYPVRIYEENWLACTSTPIKVMITFNIDNCSVLSVEKITLSVITQNNTVLVTPAMKGTWVCV